MPEERQERRAILLGRSAAAPISLALSTIAGIAGAVLALLPAAVGRKPSGRFDPRRAGEFGAPAANPAEPPPAR
jgi:hypothetical protein